MAAAVDMKNWLFSASTAMINGARDICYFKIQMSLTPYTSVLRAARFMGRKSGSVEVY